MVVLNKALLDLAGIVRKLIENTMIGFCNIRLSILGTLLENPFRTMYSLCFNNAILNCGFLPDSIQTRL